jgi:micrococcal nuclease
MNQVPLEDYVRVGNIIKIIDGDTIDVDTDMGCDIRLKQRIRLYGINAPERREAAGMAAKAFLEQLLAGHTLIVLKTHKNRKEKYGRYLGEIFIPGESVSINMQMVNAGHAVEFMV